MVDREEVRLEARVRELKRMLYEVDENDVEYLLELQTQITEAELKLSRLRMGLYLEV